MPSEPKPPSNAPSGKTRATVKVPKFSVVADTRNEDFAVSLPNDGMRISAVLTGRQREETVAVESRIQTPSGGQSDGHSEQRGRSTASSSKPTGCSVRMCNGQNCSKAKSRKKRRFHYLHSLSSQGRQLLRTSLHRLIRAFASVAMLWSAYNRSICDFGLSAPIVYIESFLADSGTPSFRNKCSRTHRRSHRLTSRVQIAIRHSVGLNPLSA